MSKSVYTIIICSFFPFPMFTQAQYMLDLSDYQWKNRLILIFSPSEDNKQYMGLLTQLKEDQPELEDRDIKVFHFLKTGDSFVGDQNISEESAQAIRTRYRIQADQNTLLLIGKDGGEKKRQIANDIDLEDLYPLIDSMPMRRREMREKSEGL